MDKYYSRDFPSPTKKQSFLKYVAVRKKTFMTIPDQAVVILEGVSHVELLVLSIVLAEYAEVVLRPVRSEAAAAG